jgi:hypothetical protein
VWADVHSIELYNHSSSADESGSVFDRHENVNLAPSAPKELLRALAKRLIREFDNHRAGGA